MVTDNLYVIYNVNTNTFAGKRDQTNNSYSNNSVWVLDDVDINFLYEVIEDGLPCQSVDWPEWWPSECLRLYNLYKELPLPLDEWWIMKYDGKTNVIDYTSAVNESIGSIPNAGMK